MSELQRWTKFFGKAKHGLAVEAKDGQVTLPVDTFREIMIQAGWREMERIITR